MTPSRASVAIAARNAKSNRLLDELNPLFFDVQTCSGYFRSFINCRLQCMQFQPFPPHVESVHRPVNHA